MTQNSLSRSNTSLEDAIKINRRAQPHPQLSGPFIISPVAPRTPSHHLSPSAHWNNCEKVSYSVFVSYFRELMKSENEVKGNWDIFKGMARFIKSRNPQQCRSHHLKVIREFKGISRYISMVMERISGLKEKMQEGQEELSEIQRQFKLYLAEQSLGNLYSIKENKIYDEEEEDVLSTPKLHLIDKTDQKQLIKTSDTYPQYQLPVNSHIQNLSIFSSRSQFKPFPHFKSKPNRSSLPSFGDEPNQPKSMHNIKNQQIELNNSFNSTQNPQNPPSRQDFNQSHSEFRQSRQDFKVLSDSFDPPKNQDKGIQKMKQFLECHYLFQLWTSKLEKIMRDT